MKKIMVIALSAILTTGTIIAQRDTTRRSGQPRTGDGTMPNTRQQPVRPMGDTPTNRRTQQPVNSNGTNRRDIIIPKDTPPATPTPITNNKPVKI